MAGTAKNTALVGLLGAAAAVGALLLGRVGPTERAERAEARLARALDEVRRHERGMVTRAPWHVTWMRLQEGFAALHAARALARDPALRRAFEQPELDRVAIEEVIDASKDRQRSIYVVDRAGAVVARREVPVADETRRPQVVDAAGQLTIPAARSGSLTSDYELSEVLMLPGELVAQVTVVSVNLDGLDGGAIVLVEELSEYVTVHMEQLGGYVVYFDDRTVIETGPAELVQALTSEQLDDARDDARLGGFSKPVEVGAGDRAFLATIVALPRVESVLPPLSYPDASVYVLFAVDVFDAERP